MTHTHTHTRPHKYCNVFGAFKNGSTGSRCPLREPRTQRNATQLWPLPLWKPGRCPQNVTHTHTHTHVRSHTHTQLEEHTDSPSSFQSSTGSSFRNSKMYIIVCTAPVLCLSLVFECVSKISLTLSAWLLQWERLSRLGKECQAWVVIVKLGSHTLSRFVCFFQWNKHWSAKPFKIFWKH